MTLGSTGSARHFSVSPFSTRDSYRSTLRGVDDAAVADDEVVGSGADQRGQEGGAEETAAIHREHYIGELKQPGATDFGCELQ